MTWHLYQYPLCPFSRKVRLVLAEKSVECELVEELPWARRDEFIDLNPAGQTPVLVGERGTTLIDSSAICEYFEETVEKSPLIGASATDRAEIRRLCVWFDQKFYTEVGHILLAERMYKRIAERTAPDGGALRTAGRNLENHLGYIDYLLDHRRWLSGPTIGLADLTAAAHLSVVDYLSALDWRGHATAKQWYSVIKSRPSFRALLSERMDGLTPPPHYDKLDF